MESIMASQLVLVIIGFGIISFHSYLARISSSSAEQGQLVKEYYISGQLANLSDEFAANASQVSELGDSIGEAYGLNVSVSEDANEGACNYPDLCRMLTINGSTYEVRIG